MLVYVIGLLIAVLYLAVARRCRGNLLLWTLLGPAVFFGAYWTWRLLFANLLVRDAETLVWFLVAGMVLGSAAAVVVLAILARGAATDENDARPAPAIDPPIWSRRRYLLFFGSASVLALSSAVLQYLGLIDNEIVPGGMFLAGFHGLAGGAFLRRPGRAILAGIGSGLAYALFYAPGLHLIGKLPLRGGEALVGALIGLPVLMILSAVLGGLFGAVLGRSTLEIAVHWRLSGTRSGPPPRE